MNTINLKEIIENHGLDKKEIAEQLFPKNKYPSLALNRVFSGEAKLDSDQISKLALISGLTISDLYGINFKVKSKSKKMFFQFEDYKAELCVETWKTKVFHNDSLFHEEIIHRKSIVLSEYLEELRIIIDKFKKDDKNN